MQDLYLYVGQLVYEARKKAKLTQQQLADQTGMGLRHIQNVENGHVNPSYETLYFLIHRLGISAETLFHPDMSDEEKETQNFLGKYWTCTKEERQGMLRTMECMADEFIKQHDRPVKQKKIQIKPADENPNVCRFFCVSSILKFPSPIPWQKRPKTILILEKISSQDFFVPNCSFFFYRFCRENVS